MLLPADLLPLLVVEAVLALLLRVELDSAVAGAVVEALRTNQLLLDQNLRLLPDTTPFRSHLLASLSRSPIL